MGLIISCFIPVMVSCGKDPNQAGCPRSLPSTAAMGVSKLVMIGRDPVIPARHAAGQVLVKLENGERLNGQAYAVASWNGETGVGELRPEGWGTESEVAPTLMATGMFFQGSHQPNGTVSGVLHDGELVNGVWTIVDLPLSGKTFDLEEVEVLMKEVPEYF